MHPTRNYYNSLGSDSISSLTPPAHFKAFAALSTIGILCCIAASVFIAPASKPLFHFGENGAITALSSVCLAMSSALAALVFYLRTKDWNFGSLFWLAMAAGCLFLSLDEQLMFHERGGHAIEATGIGKAEFFRNWNDLIVISYGFVALAIAAVFGREILNCRTFAILFAIGFAFYVIHTGIDSILPKSVAWKDIPEESSKLLSVFCLFLAVSAQALALVEKMLNRNVAAGRSTGHKELNPVAI